MSQKTRRVALVTCTGYDCISGPLLNTAEFLGRSGWEVDVFGHVTGKLPSPEFTSERVHYHPFRPRHAAGRVATWIGMQRWLRRRIEGHSYRCIMGYDPDGLVVAALAAIRQRRPYWYYSLELFIPPAPHEWKAWLRKGMERILGQRAERIVTQDPMRATWLARDLAIPPDRILVVPNTSLEPADGRRDEWLREELGIPRERVIVLSIGSLIREHMAASLAESAMEWPDPLTLVLHGWFAGKDEELRCREAARRRPDRVRLSTRCLSPREKDRVYRSADLGLVFYEPINDNLRLVGAASGKLFDFMRCGVPVVGRRLPGMDRLIDQPGWGILVESLQDLPHVLLRMMGERQRYSDLALATYARFGGPSAYRIIGDALER